MKSRIDLNKNWRISGYGKNGEVIGPINGIVPGHVHTDLLHHGLIPDPMWRDQALETQWIESFDWVYETEFEWPADADRDAAVVYFEGLDTIASIYLNDKPIGTSQNMFIKHSFPVKDVLQVGYNRLRVHFTSVQTYLQDKDIGRYVSLFSQDRVFLRRMQCTFGWDWVHRLVSFGIWRPVYLDCQPNGSIQAACVRTLCLDEESAKLSWEVEAMSCVTGNRLYLQLLNPAGNVVWDHVAEFDTDLELNKGEFTVAKPLLWWPAGYGEANLYTFRTQLLSSESQIYDERSEEIGIRTVEVEQIPDAQGSSFTVVVNGERIFAKGGNWVPADPFPSAVTKERYEHLLQTLVDGNMNMLRVWGGGTYELPEFWAACNRLGIMVSLDFMMACAEYPEQEQWFIDEMKIEVEAAVKELRNHPSLIFWCGDNELAMNNNPEDDYWGKHVCALVTEPLCAKLDPIRPFFPTSPYYGRPFNSQDEGDCHYSTWYDVDFILGDMVDYRERICQGRGRFLSECAVAGSPPLSSLLKMMTKEDVGDETAEIWEFRTNDNPYNGQDELTHYRMLEKTANTLYGKSNDLFLKVKKLEYVQYEFARLKGEHYRRRKYSTSGLLFWMYNDCWPASGWSMVDYFRFPKAGYYGAKKAFRPLMISLEDRKEEIGIWMVNDTLEEHHGEIAVRSAKTGGDDLFSNRFEVCVPSNAAIMVGTLNKEEIGLADGASDVVVQAIWHPNREEGRETAQSTTDQVTTDQAVFFDGLPKDLQCTKATLQVRCLPHDGHSGVIEISTDGYARVVTIEEELLVEDNYFDLMPGETRKIAYKTKSAISWMQTPKVTCWNG